MTNPKAQTWAEHLAQLRNARDELRIWAQEQLGRPVTLTVLQPPALSLRWETDVHIEMMVAGTGLEAIQAMRRGVAHIAPAMRGDS